MTGMARETSAGFEITFRGETFEEVRTKIQEFAVAHLKMSVLQKDQVTLTEVRELLIQVQAKSHDKYLEIINQHGGTIPNIPPAEYRRVIRLCRSFLGISER